MVTASGSGIITKSTASIGVGYASWIDLSISVGQAKRALNIHSRSRYANRFHLDDEAGSSRKIKYVAMDRSVINWDLNWSKLE